MMTNRASPIKDDKNTQNDEKQEALQHLDFSNLTKDEIIQALQKEDKNRSKFTLCLSRNIRDTDVCNLIADFIHNHKIAEISLIGNNFIPLGNEIKLMQALSANNYLQKITLAGAKLSCTLFNNFLQSLHNNKSVTHLNLSDMTIWDDNPVETQNRIPPFLSAIRKLLEVNQTLISLNLSELSISQESATLLAASLLKNSTLKELILRHNSISYDGTIALFNALTKHATTNLEMLDLSYNSANTIGDGGLERACADYLKCDKATLKTLDLRGNALNKNGNGYKLIFNALCQNSSLKLLDLGNNGSLRAKDTTALCTMLCQNHTLTELNLFNSEIDSTSIEEIIKSLKLNSSLQVFGFDGSHLTNAAAEKLITLIEKHNHTLTDVSISNYQLPPQLSQRLNDALKHNRELEEKNHHNWQLLAPLISFFRANKDNAIVNSGLSLIKFSVQPLTEEKSIRLKK